MEATKSICPHKSRSENIAGIITCDFCGENLSRQPVKTKLADRITKGEVIVGKPYTSRYKEYIPLLVKEGNAIGTIATTVPYNHLAQDYDHANAELIAEAFNVTNETGLSPRELKEQRDEAVVLLKHIFIYARLTNETRDKMNDFLNKVKP